jgi:hypothetical protein
MDTKEKEEKELIVKCPHCDEYIIIEKLNCCIFRHAVYINTQKQINPHTPQDICEQLVKDKLILGCGKPFKIIVDVNDDDKITTEICDYNL